MLNSTPLRQLLSYIPNPIFLVSLFKFPSQNCFLFLPNHMIPFQNGIFIPTGLRILCVGEGGHLCFEVPLNNGQT